MNAAPERIERDLHDAFLIGIALKGASALLETVLGVLLMYTHVVTNFVLTLTTYALIEDPDNFFATHLRALAAVSPQAQFLGGLYLLLHGAVKCALMLGLWLDKAWAYPASIVVMLLFMFYEVVRFFETYSLAYLALILFDAIVVGLIIHEYRHQWRQRFANRDRL